ncbi:phosphotransferase [Agreia sp. COWG]|uniref:phosphotransferase n=1 Tax=Agreia sp. COWG TaxID=2773266 RepID=UPI0019266DBC|nr:phosphotransferase [Agreia sp. COWG]CAD5990923.1 APH domain-containing protein [Agreia sp. COWG]
MTSRNQSRRVYDQTKPILEQIGKAEADIVDVKPLLGRNVSGIYTFDDGLEIFVKRITGLGAEGRHFRSVSFENAVSRSDDSTGMRAPKLIASMPTHNLLAYSYVSNGAGFGKSIRDDEATDGEFARVGRGLAALHRLAVTAPELTDATAPFLPPSGPNALSVNMYFGQTMGQLEMWRYIQRDDVLRKALDVLVEPGEPASRVPVHGDLRGDQILLTSNECWIIDWEEFRLGDAARDIGAMLGEIFYHRMRSSITSLAVASDSVTDRDVIEHGSRAIDEVVPKTRLLWESYLHAADAGSATDDFVERCIGFFGWQLFDRALASGTFFGRISALDRALAGIGREAIVGGAAYGTTLGLSLEKRAA